jgi:cysteinyl-tRNA synthetase
MEILEQNEEILKKLKTRIQSIEDNGELQEDKIKEYDDKFKEELSNNLNTANAITVLYDVLKDDSLTGKSKLELVSMFDKVLSLDLLKVDIDKDLEEKVTKLIEERNKYKEQKNYEKADEIRKQIEDLGVQIKDTREGTKIVWM